MVSNFTRSSYWKFAHDEVRATCRAACLGVVVGEQHALLGHLVEIRRARAFMRSDRLRLFNRVAVQQIRGNSVSAEGQS